MKSSNVFAHETLLHSFLFGIVGVMKLYTALILGLIISFTCLQLQIMVSDYSLAHKDHCNVLHEMLRKNINLDTTADVTLVSADNTKHFAHRYILGTQSPVLADLLSENKDSSVLVIGDWGKTEIRSLLQFIYLGETSILAEHIDNFLILAKEMGVKSLINVVEKAEKNEKEESANLVKDEPPLSCNDLVTDKGEDSPTNEISESESKENVVSSLEHESVKFTYCPHCNYSTKHKNNIGIHIKAVHLKIKHACKECGKNFAQKSSLNLHIRSIHEGVSYPCDFCEYKATTMGNLRQHTSGVHQISIQI